MRKPSEILGFSFDDADLILGDRLMAEGEPTVLAGAGGVGKSRLALLLIACQITGRDFIGIPTYGPPRRWVVLQGENSNRRLQIDLANLRAWLGEKDWALVDEHLVIHTLENDTDGDLSLEDRADEISSVIQENAADVAVFDPLNCFSLKDLNTDVEMRAIVTAIAAAARQGNPRRAILVLQHAITGRAGAQKAVGFDRSSFGRNSKVLLAWTRAQINVAPATPDSNDSLVVACGKNNNGREFQPFAIKLNSAGIYEVDSSFSLDEWTEVVAGSKGKRGCTVEQLLEILGDDDLKRSALVKRIMDARGCGKTAAYDAVDAALAKKKIMHSKLEDTYAKR
jgi:hypothetical protein